MGADHADTGTTEDGATPAHALPALADVGASGTQFAGPVDAPDEYEIVDAAEGRSGGEGITWRAIYRGRFAHPVEYAIKRFHRPPSDDGWPDHRLRQLWADQIRLMRLVRHPHLVKYHEMFGGHDLHDRGAVTGEPTLGAMQWWLLMDWIDGPSLHDLVRSGQATIEQRMRWLAQVADAVDLLHSGLDTGGTALFHNDIKPANILVGSAGNAVLVDFGLLRYEGDEPQTVSSLTPPYAAPEVHADRRARGTASDLWSLAATAYFAITGEHPAMFNQGLMRDNLRRALATITSDARRTTDNLMAVLAASPQDRPTSALGWINSLRRDMGLEPMSPAPRIVSQDDTGRSSVTRRRPGRVAALAVLAAAAAAVMAVVVVNASRDTKTGVLAETVIAPTPSEPTAVSLTALDGKATVSFGPPTAAGSSAVSGYVVSVSPGGQTVSATGSPVTVNGLTNGTVYSVTVNAVNGAGNGPASKPVTVTPAGVPTKPIKPSVHRNNGKSLVIDMVPPSDNGSPLTKIKLNVRCADENEDKSAEIDMQKEPFDADMPNGKTCVYWLAYRNAVGWGVDSERSDPVTAGDVPDAPKRPVAVAAKGRVDLSFEPGADNGIAVQEFQVALTDIKIVSIPATKTAGAPTAVNATFTDVQAGNPYAIRVRARNDAGWGAWSDPTPPVTPT